MSIRNKFFNKKVILGFVVFLILLVGGFFYWQKMEKGTKGSPEDYIIMENSEGTFIKNDRAGLTARAPEGWKTEIVEAEEGWVMFYHPEAELKREEEKLISLPINKGCLIEAIVNYKKTSLAEIKFNIENTLIALGAESEEFSDVKLGGHQAIKVMFSSQRVGNGISIHAPYNDKIYIFNLIWAQDEEEKCIREFEKFLETISIP